MANPSPVRPPLSASPTAGQPRRWPGRTASQCNGAPRSEFCPPVSVSEASGRDSRGMATQDKEPSAVAIPSLMSGLDPHPGRDHLAPVGDTDGRATEGWSGRTREPSAVAIPIRVLTACLRRRSQWQEQPERWPSRTATATQCGGVPDRVPLSAKLVAGPAEGVVGQDSHPVQCDPDPSPDRTPPPAKPVTGAGQGVARQGKEPSEVAIPNLVSGLGPHPGLDHLTPVGEASGRATEEVARQGEEPSAVAIPTCLGVDPQPGLAPASASEASGSGDSPTRVPALNHHLRPTTSTRRQAQRGRQTNQPVRA